jgi:hypothetical protein
MGGKYHPIIGGKSCPAIDRILKEICGLFSTLTALKDRKIVKAFLYLQSFLTDSVFEYTKVTFLWRL